MLTTRRLWQSEPAVPLSVGEPGRGATVPLLAHIPHAGTWIPDDVRDAIVLDDEALADELLAMTDWHTDRLAAPAAVATGGVAVVNRVSRLVVDVERLPDEREPMAAKGMAAVYTRTSAGAVLRNPTTALRRALLARFFHPWGDTVERSVDRLVAAHQRCLVLDVHSFPSDPLPYEDAAPARPDVCLGYEDAHVPGGLVAELEAACRAAGRSVAHNEPFAGAYVPLSRHGRDPRVRAVMLEVNRGTYLDETSGVPGPGFQATAALVGDLIRRCAAWAAGEAD